MRQRQGTNWIARLKSGGAKLRRRRIALACMSMILTTLVAELSLRPFVDRRDWRDFPRFEFVRYFRPDPTFGYLPRPRARIEYARFGASFRTNRFGLRGDEVPMPRTSGRRRVVVLGDSFAWGHGVAEGECFADRLGRELPETDVINLGVPGFDVPREREYFIRLGAKFHPDVVVLALCQNDIRLPARPRHDAAAQRAPEESSFQHIKRVLAAQSCLYTLARNAVAGCKPLSRAAVAVGLKDGLGGMEMLDDSLHASLVCYPPSVQEAMERLRVDLVALNEVVRAAGARLVIGLIPAVQAVDQAELARSVAYTQFDVSDFKVDKPYRLLGMFGEENGICIIDALPVFRAVHDSGARLYLPRDIHFNALGHRMFAEALRVPVEQLLEKSARDTGRIVAMERAAD